MENRFQCYHEVFTPMEIVEIACEQLHYDNKVYMFTWNPKPTFYEYRKLGNNDYISQWVLMISVLKEFSRCSDMYCFIPEISDEGKLHVHGWFMLSDKLKWLKSVRPLLRKNGFMKINRLHTKIEKIDYYYKEIDETKDILNQYFYVLTHFTIGEILREVRQKFLYKRVKKTQRKNWMVDRLFAAQDAAVEDEDFFEELKCN